MLLKVEEDMSLVIFLLKGVCSSMQKAREDSKSCAVLINVLSPQKDKNKRRPRRPPLILLSPNNARCRHKKAYALSPRTIERSKLTDKS